VDDYLTTLQTNPGVIYAPSSLTNTMMGPMGQQKIAQVQMQLGYAPNGPRGMGGTLGGGTATRDYGVANWNILKPAFDAYDPTPGTEVVQDFASAYPGGATLPTNVQQQLSMASIIAPQAISTFNSAYNNARQAQLTAHVLMDEDIEPTALRLAK